MSLTAPEVYYLKLLNAVLAASLLQNVKLRRIYFRVRLSLRCRQREAEASALQRGDGADGQDGQSPNGGGQPRSGSIHQRYTSGARQTDV